MRIQCERAQTRFDPVQCALGVQCEQALTVFMLVLMLEVQKGCNGDVDTCI